MTLPYPDEALYAAVIAYAEGHGLAVEVGSVAQAVVMQKVGPILEAALPHLQAAILADLRERCDGAAARLATAAQEASRQSEIYLLSGKAEGVSLTVSYIDEEMRVGQ